MSNRKRPRHLHLMADYGSAGVWDHDGTPLDPVRLPLSPKLRTRLARWVRAVVGAHGNGPTFAHES